MEGYDPGYKVRLVSVSSYYNAPGSDEFEQVVFRNTPVLSERRSVDYTPVSPIHMPGSIQIYRNTSSRDFTLQAKFISRTSDEALYNQQALQLLRGWCEPYFGSSSTLSDEQLQYRREQTSDARRQTDGTANQRDRIREGIELLGAPPDVLYLYAYAANGQRAETTQAQALSGQMGINLHKIPVVITSLEITFPEEVDYIPTSDTDPSPFPVRLDVNIALAETHSPAEYSRFSLSDFKKGRLVNF